LRAPRAAGLLLLLAACGPAAAPPPSAAPASARPLASVLAAEPEEFDFGRVLPGRPLQKQFTLRNLGRAPLTIASVTTDCGCLVVGDYARQLGPGAATTLTLVLHTPEQPGRVLRNVVVRTAAPHEESLGLRLRATVVAEGASSG